MPIEPLQIVEILERSEQGITRPFLCRCDDDHLYYVKGRGAGRSSLLCEWLAGHLALAFGLPIPPFAIVEAPQSLVELFPEGGDLGAGPAFGSRVVAHTQELSMSHLCDVPTQLQRDVLMFDWWVRNSDRTLTSLSGNPNLLWDADAKQPVVIDHNVALIMNSTFSRSARRMCFIWRFRRYFKILWSDCHTSSGCMRRWQLGLLPARMSQTSGGSQMTNAQFPQTSIQTPYWRH